jgi:hypothetical protein
MASVILGGQEEKEIVRLCAEVEESASVTNADSLEQVNENAMGNHDDDVEEVKESVGADCTETVPVQEDCFCAQEVPHEGSRPEQKDAMLAQQLSFLCPFSLDTLAFSSIDPSLSFQPHIEPLQPLESVPPPLSERLVQPVQPSDDPFPPPVFRDRMQSLRSNLMIH